MLHWNKKDAWDFMKCAINPNPGLHFLQKTWKSEKDDEEFLKDKLPWICVCRRLHVLLEAVYIGKPVKSEVSVVSVSGKCSLQTQLSWIKNPIH